MNTHLKKALNASEKALPEGLFENTKNEINYAARKRAATHFALCAGVSFLSIISAIIEAFSMHEFSLQSGFYSYLSLFGTDTSIALSSTGKDLLISAVETFPVLAGALFFASVCALCVSAARATYWRTSLAQTV